MEGAQWSQEETLIIHEKLRAMMLDEKALSEFEELYPWQVKKYKKGTRPNPPKVILSNSIYVICLLLIFTHCLGFEAFLS